jgi:hypothetical protein
MVVKMKIFVLQEQIFFKDTSFITMFILRIRELRYLNVFIF